MERTIERVFLIKFLVLNNKDPFKRAQVKAHLFQDPSDDLIAKKQKTLMHRFVEGCGYKLRLWNQTHLA